MSNSVRLNVGGETSYRVEVRAGVTYVFGQVPLLALADLTKRQPKAAVADLHLAERMGATLAFGTREACDSALGSAPARVVDASKADHAQLDPGALEWVRYGEHGQSSCFMLWASTGYAVTPGARTLAHPADTGDFRRCRLLWEASARVRERSAEIASSSNSWRAILARWDELCNAMDTEAPRWREGEGTSRTVTSMLREVSTGSAP